MATTINTSYSNRKLVVGYSPGIKRQAAFDTAIAQADLDKRQPQTTPVFHVSVVNRDEIRDCTGEFVVKEKLTDKLAQFTLAFDVTALFAAGYIAYAFGASGSPTGTPADEIQTVTSDASGGTFTMALDFEGLSETTGDLAFDITAADFKIALEALRPIKSGNLASVTGTLSTGFIVTFGGTLAKANIALMTIDNANLTGETSSVVAATQDGQNNTQLITRTSSDFPILFSFTEGFEGETNGIKLYKNLVVGTYTLTVTRRGKATLQVVCFGSPDGEILSGYTIPDCETIDPVFAKDCRLRVGGDYVTNDLIEAVYNYSNEIPIDEFTFPFDDINPEQLQSGDKTSSYTFSFTGSPTSALFLAAENSDTDFKEIILDIGVPGERLSIISPNSQFKLSDDAQIVFVGGAGGRSRSSFNLTARPSPDGGGIIDRAEYHGANTTQFLQT